MIPKRRLIGGGAFILAALAGMMVLPDYHTGRIDVMLLRFPGIDKIAHFAMHAAIAGALYLAAGPSLTRKVPLRIALALCGSLIYALLDEVHQLAVPGRSFEYQDVLAGVLGAAAGLVALSVKRMRRTRWFGALGAIGVALFLVVGASHREIRHYNKGMEHERQKEYRLAHEEYLLALKEGNARAGVLNAISWLELEFLDSDPQSAYGFAARAVRQEPGNADYLDTCGWALHRLGRYEEALVHLEKAYALKPGIFCINYHLGATYYRLGERGKALAHLTTQMTEFKDPRYAGLARDLVRKIGEKGS